MTFPLEPPKDPDATRAEQVEHLQEAKAVRVSLDLVKAAKVHRQFLKSVSKIPELLRDSAYLRNAIRRYEQVWISLLKDHGTNLTAPFDVDFVWHCHQLNPVDHLQYLKAKGVGIKAATRVLFESTEDAQKSLEESKRLWKEAFPAEDFEIYVENVDEDDIVADCNKQLLEACLRQNDFYHQIAPSWYAETNFLKESVARYKRFLLLIKMNPGKFLTPTYDIDLIWHTHMRYASHYKEDMEQLLGYVLDHDDKDSDRSDGSKLSNGWALTDELWKSSYGHGQKISGTSYRGKGKSSDEVFIPGKEYDYFAAYDMREHIPVGGSDTVVVFNLVTEDKPTLSYCQRLRLRFKALRWQVYLDMTHTYVKSKDKEKDADVYTPRKLVVPGDCCNFVIGLVLMPIVVFILVVFTILMPLFACCEIPTESDGDYTYAELTDFEAFKSKWARLKATSSDSGGGCGGSGCGGGCGGG